MAVHKMSSGSRSCCTCMGGQVRLASKILTSFERKKLRARSSEKLNLTPLQEI